MSTHPRSLGLVMLIALVVGNMIGSGVFLLPSALAQYGSISLLGWGFTAIGAILLALVFARLGGAMPATGGGLCILSRSFWGFYWVSSRLLLLGIRLDWQCCHLCGFCGISRVFLS